MNTKFIIITGPTAAGKTGLGIKIAQQFGGAIISADSRMVYQGLDIGTGKPTWEKRQLDRQPWLAPSRSEPWGPVYSIGEVDHHLLDVVPPEASFTLSDWLQKVEQIFINFAKAKLIPIVVGGTGLYLKALVEGYLLPPTDPKLRAELDQLPLDRLRAEVAAFDPITAQREQSNRRRLIRALEVIRLTGQPMSDTRRTTMADNQPLVLGIDLPREGLYQRIDRRIEERLQAGLVEEVANLLDKGVSPEWLKKIGLEYRIITNWLRTHQVTHRIKHLRSVNDGALREKLPKERARLEEELRGAIHAYARRQLTFLRHQLPVKWVKSEQEAREKVRTFLGLDS